MPPVLTAQHLHKSYGPRPLLNDASFAIEAGERVGLIGANGSGKSTLGKILAGVDQPDGGTISRKRDLEVGYLAQEPALDPEHTAYQVVEAGLARWRDAMTAYDQISDALALGPNEETAAKMLASQSFYAAEIERLGGWDRSHSVLTMLEHLGVGDPQRKVGTLSGGERRRVALAQLLVSRPGFAIFDEPTNHLDADTCSWLEGHLIDEFPGSLVLVTHDRYFLDRVVNRVMELDRGVLSTFEGNYARYLELRAERDAHEARVEANRMNILRRERDWLSRRAPARTTKQTARIQRAEDLEVAVKNAHRRTETTAFELAQIPSGKRLVSAQGLSKSINGKVLFNGVDLVVPPGERVGIVGQNGTGKTTLLKTLLGEVDQDAGTVTFAPTAKVMYFDQNRAGIDDTATVLDNVREGNDKVLVGDQWITIYSYLERFLFDAHKQRQAAGTLSGGERARLALAKMLRGGANLVLLDEPTNDLDLPTLATLEDMLTTFGGAAIVVTHDRYFLDRVATSILAFEGEGKVTRYAGGFADYEVQRALVEELAKARQREASEKAAPKKAPAAAAVAEASKPAAKKKLTGSEERELAALPDKIDAAEQALAKLDAELNDPGLYSKAGAIVEVQAKREAAQKALDALMERWEALEARKA